MRTLLAAVALIFAANTAVAQQPTNQIANTNRAVANSKIELNKCLDSIDAAAMRNNYILACYQAELRRKDSKLNDVYSKILSKFANIRTKLVEGQRAWISYRDNWCGFEGLVDQPPSPEISKAICLVELTEAQSNRLNELNSADASSDSAKIDEHTAGSSAGANSGPNPKDDLADLCKNYSEEYRQNALMDIASQRVGQKKATDEQRARLAQQIKLCPDWQKQQSQEAAKQIKSQLRSIISGFTECSSQMKQIDAAFARALEIPEMQREIETAVNLLGAGQKQLYCERAQNALQPYFEIRDLLARCGSTRSINLSTTFHQLFGGVANEVRQNGCRN